MGYQSLTTLTPESWASLAPTTGGCVLTYGVGQDVPISYRLAADPESTFAAPIDILTPTAGWKIGGMPSFRDSNGDLWLAYCEKLSGVYNIRVLKSTTGDPADFGSPVVAVPNTDTGVAAVPCQWAEMTDRPGGTRLGFTYYVGPSATSLGNSFCYTDDGGTNWTSVPIGTPVFEADGAVTYLGEGKTLAVMRRTGTPGIICASKSADYGATWTEAVELWSTGWVEALPALAYWPGSVNLCLIECYRTDMTVRYRVADAQAVYDDFSVLTDATPTTFVTQGDINMQALHAVAASLTEVWLAWANYTPQQIYAGAFPITNSMPGPLAAQTFEVTVPTEGGGSGGQEFEVTVPVVGQPAVLYPLWDTHLDPGDPNTRMDSGSILYVYNQSQAVSLLAFEIPDGVIVESADLSLYQTATASAVLDVTASRVLRAATAAATWNKFDGSSSWGTGGSAGAGDVTATGETVTGVTPVAYERFELPLAAITQASVGSTMVVRLKTTTSGQYAEVSSADTANDPWLTLVASLTAPVDVTVTPMGAGAIHVEWTEHPLATGYEVYRGLTENPTELRATVGEVGYFDDTATPETYHYRIVAIAPDGYGNSDYSNDVSCTIPEYHLDIARIYDRPAVTDGAEIGEVTGTLKTYSYGASDEVVSDSTIPVDSLNIDTFVLVHDGCHGGSLALTGASLVGTPTYGTYATTFVAAPAGTSFQAVLTGRKVTITESKFVRTYPNAHGETREFKNPIASDATLAGAMYDRYRDVAIATTYSFTMRDDPAVEVGDRVSLDTLAQPDGLPVLVTSIRRNFNGGVEGEYKAIDDPYL